MSVMQVARTWAAKSPNARSPWTNGATAWLRRDRRGLRLRHRRVITPIGVLKDATEFIGSEDAKAGETTMAIREQLLGIQTGTVADTHGWLTPLA